MKHSRLLPVPLEENEIQEYAIRLAGRLSKKMELETEKSDIAKVLGGKIKVVESEIQNLANSIRDECEERDIDCDIRRNNDTGQMETIRMDTEEVIETRDMTDEEKNLDIFDDQEENK